MLGACCDEDNRSRFHWSMLVRDLNGCASADNIVDLVFRMRLLRINITCRQNIETGAQRVCAQKFQITLLRSLLFLNKLRKIKGFHYGISPFFNITSIVLYTILKISN